MNGPVGGVGGNDVQVAVDEQGRPGRVLPAQPGHHARPARVRLQHHRLQAHVGEQGGDVLGRWALAGPRVIPVVARVDPDQVAAQAGDLVFGGHGRARCMLGHPPIVAPAAGSGPAALAAGGRGGDGAGDAGGPGGLIMGWMAGRTGQVGARGHFAACGRICYGEAGRHGSAVLRHTSGWRNRQTR